MTREEAIRHLEAAKLMLLANDNQPISDLYYALDIAIKALEQEPYDFARWVAREIFDDEWEYNKDAFAEIACCKLAKLGIVRRMGDEWELVEPQESEDKE